MGNQFTPELQKLLDRVGIAGCDLAIANDESAARASNVDRIEARIRACKALDFEGDWLQLCEAAKLSRGDIAREIGDFQEATAHAAMRGGKGDHGRLAESERALRAAAYRGLLTSGTAPVVHITPQSAVIEWKETKYPVAHPMAEAFEKMLAAKGQPVGLGGGNPLRKPSEDFASLKSKFPNLAAIIEKGKGNSGYRLTVFD